MAAACAELNTDLPWTCRRANILVDGLTSAPDLVGKHIKIGDVLLYITGETDPCPNMDRQHAGLMQALMPDWRGGMTCKVISDGRIKRGQTITMIG